MKTNLEVVCIPAEHAHIVRTRLKKENLWDEGRMLQKFDDVIAIPVFDNQPKLACVLQHWSDAEIRKLPLPPSAKSRKKTPGQKLKESVQTLLKKNYLSEALLIEVPHKWEKYGDLVIFPSSTFKSPHWHQLGEELWLSVAHVLSCKRLAVHSRIANDGFRTPQVAMLLGNEGVVIHYENGIKYSFDVTKCMFSSGNVSEKLRVASWNCSNETVVDLYAGIGYFTLPYLVHSKAKYVHACEWNPNAVKALRNNLVLNGVESRCTIHEGDNRRLHLLGIADRVNLGLIPSSEDSWPTAVRVLKAAGGVLHVHLNHATSHRKVVETLDQDDRKEDQLVVLLDNDIAKRELTQDQFKNDNDIAKREIIQDQFKNDNDIAKREVTQDQFKNDNDIAKREIIQDQIKNDNDNDIAKREIIQETKTTVYDVDPTLDDYSCHNSTDQTASSQDAWAEKVAKKFKCLLEEEKGGIWLCEILHIEKVKSYAPHVDHIVLDLNCLPKSIF